MTENIETIEKEIDSILRPDVNFDIVKRELIIAERRAVLYFIDGYTKDELYQKIIEFYYKLTPKDLKNIINAEEFSKRKVPFIEVSAKYNSNIVAAEVLTGQSALIIDGISGAIIADTRNYPIRAIKEPEKDRSLRGSRDSFLETLIMNTAMLRRRVRDENFRTEYIQIGRRTHLDVAICYIDGLADKKLVDNIKKRLKEININSISMTQEALSEKLVNKNFFNPLPRIKFTERPDFASAVIMDGKVVVIPDNSPSAMVFPTSFFDFFKETNDFYFPPLIGTYTRLIRILVAVLMVYLTPIYLLICNNPQLVPDSMKFLLLNEPPNMPLLLQFLILEFLIDGLKLASINTPDTLSGSLGIIGGLLLSEFMVTAGWFSLPSILLMSFVTISSFSQPSYELSYSFKFERMALLIITQIFGLYGIITAAVLLCIIKLLSNTVSGKRYFYPIIPFNFKDFIKIFVRMPIEKNH